MAAAKGIAYVLDRPIVGVSTLDVLAEGASAAGHGSVAALVHARPGEVFWALYRCEGADVKRVTEDQVSTVEDVIGTASGEARVVFCGSGAEGNRQVLEDRFGPGSVLAPWFNTPRASVLASLGLRRLLQGEPDDVESLVPSYVRRPTPVVRLEGSPKP